MKASIPKSSTVNFSATSSIWFAAAAGIFFGGVMGVNYRWVTIVAGSICMLLGTFVKAALREKNKKSGK